MIKLALLLATIAVTAGATCPPLAIKNDSHAPFYWVHVPKTGSSFAATVEAVCCGSYNTIQTWFGEKNLSEWPCMHRCAYSNKLARLGAHAPIGRGQETLIEDEDCFFSSHAVIMNLRRPKARLASGFFHHFHSCHEMQDESNGHLLGKLNMTGPYRDKVVALLKTIIANDTRLETDLRRYVDCVRGCSVKMVSGRTCGSNVSNSTHRFPQHLMDSALRRIERFSFVGFQEHWEASVKRFLAKFGGAFSMELLHNSRKGHTEFTEEEERKVSSLLERPEFHDEADEALYWHAYSFHWNRTHHNVTVDTQRTRSLKKADKIDQ